ncbi:hypothetical protein Tco_0523445 [Tanacetum coccineum]
MEWKMLDDEANSKVLPIVVDPIQWTRVCQDLENILHNVCLGCRNRVACEMKHCYEVLSSVRNCVPLNSMVRKKKLLANVDIVRSILDDIRQMLLRQAKHIQALSSRHRSTIVFFELQLTSFPPRNCNPPDVLLQSSLHHAWSASE